MHHLYEKSNMLNEPIECFRFDAKNEDFPVKSHWHYFAEIIYMYSGTSTITVNGKSETLTAGDLMMIPPSAVHSITAPDGVFPIYAGLKFDLSKFPSQISYSPSPRSIFRFAAETEMPFCIRRDDTDEMECSGIFADCIAEAQSRRYGYDMMLRAQIYRLIYRIIRFWTAQGLDLSICKEPADSSDSLDCITELIDEHLSEPIRVQELAARCHLSYSAFAARFRERYGISCKDYIIRMRIFKAEEYLRFTDLDMLSISRATGFSDSSHLIRCFQQHRGITPKQFRMQYRNHGTSV